MTKGTKLSLAADHGDLPAQVQHPFHPGQGHSLKLVPDDDGVEFRCNGCKVRGVGVRYECERGAACDLDLHIRCALAPERRKIGAHRFVLLHSPPGAGKYRRLCDACGGAATGFVYHSAKLDHDVHPCCAGLPETLDLAGIFFKLRMKDDALQGGSCALCAEKKTRWWGDRSRVNRGCWSYRSVRGCGDDDVFLHVACVRELACDDSFTSAFLGNAMAARASDAGTGTRKKRVKDPISTEKKSSGTRSVVVDASRVVNRRDQEMVTVKVKASDLRALLLKGKGRGNRGGLGKALKLSLKVFVFIARVVIGIFIGDPTAMFVAVGGAIFSGGG